MGQGNGAGPAIWELISTSLPTIIAIQGFGVNPKTTLSGLAFTVVAFAIVDDMDLSHLDQDSPPICDARRSTFKSTVRKNQ